MKSVEAPQPDAAAALERLKAGNQRFLEGESVGQQLAADQREGLVKAQRPFAIVLGCSDSRVPAELIFDQGLGDLFVIRVAGNIVAPSQIGSVEFAAAKFGTQLVVVLGHTNCGAISATVDALRGVDGPSSEGLAAIVNRIRPTVEPLLDIYPSDDHALESAATRTNVIASVAQLREGSEILGGLIDSGALRIVGAQYDLASGVVEFYA